MDWENHPEVQQAADYMQQGGVIAYPTEAVWGLGCAPDNKQAVYRILSLKNRDVRKGLILIAASIEQLDPYLDGLDPVLLKKLSDSWPGPVTWLVPVNDRAPAWITGEFDTLALRVSGHPLVQGLCNAFGGPIVSTSANPQGEPPALTAKEAKQYFGERLDFISPGNVGDNGTPSRIIDLQTDRVIRA